MTLRLIQSDERAVVPCHYEDGPATILVIINETPGLPCCDRCARRFYTMNPDHVRLASLDVYVDMFAAAKQAAFATPEQFTEPVPITASTALDDKVLRRIWADRVIYCRVRWCEESRRLTAASQRLNAIGGPWYPACQDCISKSDPDQVEIAPMSEDNTTWELEMADKCARDHHWSKPVSLALWWTAGSATVASIILGIVMAAHGHALNVISDQSGGYWLAWGVVFMVVLPVLCWAIAGIAWFVKTTPSQAELNLRAQKATLPQGQHLGVPVDQLVGTAAMAAGAYVVHEGLKHHREHVAAQRAAARERQAALVQHQQAMNNANRQQQDNAAAGLGYKTNDQIGYGAPITHHNGPGPTRRSDIYGNLI